MVVIYDVIIYSHGAAEILPVVFTNNIIREITFLINLTKVNRVSEIV